jgi:hypothetical protein
MGIKNFHLFPPYGAATNGACVVKFHFQQYCCRDGIFPL